MDASAWVAVIASALAVPAGFIGSFAGSWVWAKRAARNAAESREADEARREIGGAGD